MTHNPVQLRYQHLARMATYCNHAVLSFQARNWTYPELGCSSNVSAKRSAMTPRKHSEKQDNCIINFHILHPVPFNVKFLLPPQESFHVLSTAKRTIFRNMQSSKMHGLWEWQRIVHSFNLQEFSLWNANASSFQEMFHPSFVQYRKGLLTSYSLHSNVAKAPSVLSFIALAAFLVEQRRRGFWAELWTWVPCTVDTEMQKFWKERVRSTWNSDFLFLSACGKCPSPHQHSPPVFATPHDAIQPARSICVRDIKHQIHFRIDMHNLHQL